MEILQFLLSFLCKDSRFTAFAPLLEKLKESNFDIKSLLSNLNPETLLPFLSGVMGSFNQTKNPSPSHCEEEGLEIISSFADKQIVECLNCYFSQPS